MAAQAAAPPPIPGDRIDPDPKPKERTVQRVHERNAAAGIGFRAFVRFSHANATLLAAGTTYYLFLSLFALIALAFAIAAIVGSANLQQLINDALATALPGLVGDEGIDAEQLRSIGQSVGLVGLLLLIYSGGGAMGAASASLHLINGAAKDGRNFIVGKIRLLGLLLVVAPLILISYAPSVVVTAFAAPVLEFVGLNNAFGQSLLLVVSLLVAFALDVAVIYVVLSTLGGIRPSRRARLIGALVGALAVEVLKYLMASIVAWSVAKPQYGAFAAPVTVLFILYLLTLALYAAASVAAAVADSADDGS